MTGRVRGNWHWHTRTFQSKTGEYYYKKGISERGRRSARVEILGILEGHRGSLLGGLVGDFVKGDEQSRAGEINHVLEPRRWRLA
jgi:hypothetical protein